MTKPNKRAERQVAGSRAVWTALAVTAVAVLSIWAINLTRPRPADLHEASVIAGNHLASALPPPRPSDPVKAAMGRWLRPDGGYILEIQEVRADGRAEAAYFNPNPIHVSRAEVKPDGAKAVVLIELRDVNYPGCIYRLTYDPAKDELSGDYFQAALEQTFEVVFIRANGQ